MASTKEAIAIVLDVGNNMNQASAGEKSFLETSLDAIKSILQRKMFAESKDEVALILFGTPDTANDLADNGTYDKISVARPLGVVNWDLLKYVENDIQPSDQTADFIDAIVVAMDVLVKGIEGKRGFVGKRLILFTDAGAPFGDDGIDDIVASMKEANIELNVIGPCLDDEEEEDSKDKPGASNGHVKEKSAQQRAGETMLQHILTKVDGDSYSFQEALPALAYFQSRQVRPMPWKAQMEIGSLLQIAVEGYIRTKEAKAKSFKNVYAKDPNAAIERARTYHLNDEDRTEVEKPDVLDGHRYGSTLVPFSQDDKEAFKFPSQKSLKVLGFTKMDHIKRHHFLGDSSMAFVAQKDDEAAAVALSALISALYESNSCAIVRRVYAANGKIQLGCLVPHIKLNYECLYYNELPFSEDLRQFTFSSLPVKESTDSNKKYEPSDAQLNLMDELINDMDLSKADKDEDGEEREGLKPKLTFNPYLQRLYQCLQQRAMQSDDPLPDLSPIIAASLAPPREVRTRCAQTVDKIKDEFKLVRRDKKDVAAAGTSVFKDDDGGAGEPAAKKQKTDEQIDGGMADLVKHKVTEVGTVTPVDDFKALLADKEQDRFEEACSMMEKRITQIVMDSFGTQSYSKALDCLTEMRQQCVKSSEAKQFNKYLTDLKESLHTKSRADFWEEIVKEKLSLIGQDEVPGSEVSRDESEAFLKAQDKQEEEKPAPTQEASDLMDDF